MFTEEKAIARIEKIRGNKKGMAINKKENGKNKNRLRLFVSLYSKNNTNDTKSEKNPIKDSIIIINDKPKKKVKKVTTMLFSHYAYYF